MIRRVIKEEFRHNQHTLTEKSDIIVSVYNKQKSKIRYSTGFLIALPTLFFRVLLQESVIEFYLI